MSASPRYIALEWSIEDLLPLPEEGSDRVDDDHLEAYLVRIGAAEGIGPTALHALAKALDEGSVSLRLWSQSGVSWTSRWELRNDSRDVLVTLASGTDVQYQQQAPFEAITRSMPHPTPWTIESRGSSLRLIEAMLARSLHEEAPGMSEEGVLYLLGLEDLQDAAAVLQEARDEANGDVQALAAIVDDCLEGHVWWSELVPSRESWKAREEPRGASEESPVESVSILAAPPSLWSDLWICLRIIDPTTSHEELSQIASNAPEWAKALLEAVPHVPNDIRAAALNQ